MELALLLNASYEPIRVVNWKKAITLLWQGKVEILEVHEREIHGFSITIKLPSVIRLLTLIKMREAHRTVRFSRANIFARDKHRCQYCNTKGRTDVLTFDHVIPISRGGRKAWENIVTACIPCNNRKSGRTPAESGMRLIKRPAKPTWTPTLTITVGLKSYPQNWRDYLYWNMELEHDTSPG